MKLPPHPLGSRKLRLQKQYIKGTDVRKLQQHLKWLGLFENKIDGVFGPETHRAVKKLQSKGGLADTGIADKNTFYFLKSLFSDDTKDWPLYRRDPGGTSYSPIPLKTPLKQIWKNRKDVNAVLLMEKDFLVVKTYKKLWCLNYKTGKTLWHIDINEENELMPLCHNGMVFVPESNKMKAYDLKKGNFKWEFNTDWEILKNPVAYKGKVFIFCSDRSVYCIRADSGKPIWHNKFRSVMTSHPAAIGNTLVMPAVNRNLYALDIEKGHLKWKKKVVEYPSHVCASKGLIYCAAQNSTIYTFDEMEGNVVSKTKISARKYDTLLLSPLAKVIFTQHNIAALDDNNNMLWEITVPFPLTSRPIIVDDTLWVGTQEGGFVYDLINGYKLWEFLNKKRIYSLVTVKFRLFAAADEYIYCFN